MTEHHADLWLTGRDADAVCITTNGSLVDGRRRGVMGRGCAKQAADRYAADHQINLPYVLGRHLKKYGNHTGVLLPPPPYTLVMIPVKHEWSEPADVELIRRSLAELVVLTDTLGWDRVVLPRPGCGSGGLDWDADGLRTACAAILDDRFMVVWQ